MESSLWEPAHCDITASVAACPWIAGRLQASGFCATLMQTASCVLQDDAQIGVDVLGWKQTITGVGHCRQVGCPESGINDAVQRLASLGYKVPS